MNVLKERAGEKAAKVMQKITANQNLSDKTAFLNNSFIFGIGTNPFLKKECLKILFSFGA